MFLLRKPILPSKLDSMKDGIRDLSRAADVEGTHGELRARLADGLRRDDADSLAMVDRGARAKSRP